VHLADVLTLRSAPAAGVSFALTRRCPLSCAHCSTSSTLESDEAPGELFVRFVETFRADDRPELLALSGGEVFLRPKLVRELADRAGLVGCRTGALSGMFWASAKRIPPAIKLAIDALDHFGVSLDVFHEREVDRHDVYRVLDTLLAEGKDVSIHLVGLGPDDPYLAERTEEVRERFDDRVPMLVNGVNAVGRAAEWLVEPESGPMPAVVEADPCTLANWPLVAFDGTIVACGNDDVVDGPAPAHLCLGHATTDGWPQIRARCLTSAMLRSIRTFGPLHTADRHSALACSGYCTTCQLLSTDPEIEASVAAAMGRPGAEFLEQEVQTLEREAGAVSFARRFGMAAYAHLVTLGTPRPVAA
jgi:pyruvate-formate lyase-activating enzyme